jgi:hypothetical protein
VINALIDEHQFTKNYGPRCIISKLWHWNIPDSKIPARKQVETRLYYFCKCKLDITMKLGL